MCTFSSMIAGVLAAARLVSRTLAPVAVAQGTMVTFYSCLVVEGPNRGNPAAGPAVKAGRLPVALHTWFVSQGALP